jgi:hypothetical protein
MVKSDKYRGWNVTYDDQRPPNEIYFAELNGVVIKAPSLVEIELKVNAEIEKQSN